MATESDLVDLLRVIGDRAPTPENTLNRLMLPTAPATPSEPRPSHRRWLPIASAAAAVVALVAVSVVVRGDDPHHPGAAEGPGPAASAPPVAPFPYRLPLNAYYASETQRRTLQRAQFVLAQRCALAHGVNVPTARIPAGDQWPAFLSTVADDIRPVTVAQARTIGYNLYPSGTSAVDNAQAGLTPRQREIFAGWTSDLKLPQPTSTFLLDGGCLGQAAQTLLENATPASLPGQWTSDGLPGLFDDDIAVNDYLNAARTGETTPTVQQAQKRWSACMAAHGYPGLSTTTDAIQKIPNMQSANAKLKAVQDVQCKQATGFMKVWMASITKAQKAVIAAHRTQLAGFKKRLATRMANAAKALK